MKERSFGVMELDSTSITGQRINLITSVMRIACTPLAHFMLTNSNGMMSTVQAAISTAVRKVGS